MSCSCLSIRASYALAAGLVQTGHGEHLHCFALLALQAIVILRSLQHVAGQTIFLLPSRNSQRALLKNTSNVALCAMGIGSDKHTPHGFRASFRTMCEEELKYPYALLRTPALSQRAGATQ